MKEILSMEQKQLLYLLNRAIHKKWDDDSLECVEFAKSQWEEILRIAQKHAVMPLLYEIIENRKDVPENLFENLEKRSRQTVSQSYKLLYVTNYVVKLLESEHISVVVLKGVSTASLYPVPELRKSGDVDLLIAKKNDIEKACLLLKTYKFKKKEKQLANHHIVFVSKEGIMIEIHTILAEPFDNQRINQYVKDLSVEYHNHIKQEDILGSILPVLEDAYDAFYLLLHMLQHFLRSGFGLKLLCDWTVFWSRDIGAKEKEQFVRLLHESGLFGFSSMITGVCVQYLGLEEEQVSFLERKMDGNETNAAFMKEILDAEEFGKSGKDRMVVMRGTSLLDYVREFHHQMGLNYPRAKKIVLIWPILWISTLAIFLRNNRTIRKTSSRAILKKAKIRSKIVNDMKLFQNHGK
ncbi:MAG: nucleotidyltransferase family protein [Velocimicrobium sp.]